jgi:hypothetical protein
VPERATADSSFDSQKLKNAFETVVAVDSIVLRFVILSCLFQEFFLSFANAAGE